MKKCRDCGAAVTPESNGYCEPCERKWEKVDKALEWCAKGHGPYSADRFCEPCEREWDDGY